MLPYLFIGVFGGGGIAALVIWLRNRNIAVKWYEWFMGSVGLVLLLFAAQNFLGSNAEIEALAGRLYAVVFGTPGLIFLAVSVRLVTRRHSATS